jgi:hypothetical protein
MKLPYIINTRTATTLLYYNSITNDILNAEGKAYIHGTEEEVMKQMPLFTNTEDQQMWIEACKLHGIIRKDSKRIAEELEREVVISRLRNGLPVYPHILDTFDRIKHNPVPKYPFNTDEIGKEYIFPHDLLRPQLKVAIQVEKITLHLLRHGRCVVEKNGKEHIIHENISIIDLKLLVQYGYTFGKQDIKDYINPVPLPDFLKKPLTPDECISPMDMPSLKWEQPTHKNPYSVLTNEMVDKAYKGSDYDIDKQTFIHNTPTPTTTVVPKPKSIGYRIINSIIDVYQHIYWWLMK